MSDTVDLVLEREPLYSIVIVHRDLPDYLSLCVQSIVTHSYWHDYEIIIVDNGSTKDSQEALDALADDAEVRVIRLDKNQYFASAANLAAEASTPWSTHLIFMHCDLIITNKNWLDLLSQAGPLVSIEEQTYTLPNGQPQRSLAESLLFVERSVWAKYGGFSQELPQIGCALPLTLRAALAGVKPQVIRTPLAHHFRLQSLNSNEAELLNQKTTAALGRVVAEIMSPPSRPVPPTS